LLAYKNEKPNPQIAHLVFADPQNAHPKKLKEQFLSNACRIMLINIENNISQKEIFNKAILFLQRNNSKTNE